MAQTDGGDSVMADPVMVVVSQYRKVPARCVSPVVPTSHHFAVHLTVTHDAPGDHSSRDQSHEPGFFCTRCLLRLTAMEAIWMHQYLTTGTGYVAGEPDGD